MMEGGRQIVALEDGWKYMVTGVDKLKRVLAGEDGVGFTPDEYINLYTTIYNMCTQKPPNEYSQELYDRYRQTFEEYINSTGVALLEGEAWRVSAEGIFAEVEKPQSIRQVAEQVLPLPGPLLHITKVPSFTQRSRLELLPRAVFNELKTTMTTILLGMIDEDREGQRVDRTLLKNVIDIYAEIGQPHLTVYEEDFEEPFRKGTTDYYSKKAQTWILEKTCPEYMIKAEECLQQEKERVADYLDKSTELKLMQDAEQELLARHADQILNKESSGCKVLLCDEKVEDLSRMFRLFSRISGLPPVSKIFKEHVNEEGLSLLKQAIDAVSSKKDEKKDVAGALELDFVRKIIGLHDKYKAYVTGCFQNHTLFHKALKEAFEVVCNKDVAGCTSAEMFATYCDNILKKGGSEKLSEEAIEENLDKVVTLLTYISDKDLFVEFHRKKLGRRLLFEKSGNDDHERSMISKLKQYFGGQFTSKMEGMLTDMTTARDNQVKFEEYLNLNQESHPRVDLGVTVLTTGHWPTYKSSDINLPSEMVRCVEVFREFYQSRTKHRKLTWIYSLGSCTVTGKFDAKPIDLIVTTYQAALLLLFNDSDKLSYSEIVTQLKLSDDDAARVLHSLSCGKYKILNKDPATRTISPKDKFEFNAKFTDKMRRIKVQLPPSDEKKKVIDDVNKDRRFAIDASLVRIMKSRKIMTHQHLVAECVEQLSRMFKPDIKLIKRRIEDLITREYLERDKDAANSYRYLA
ncbi:hypothetical protein ACP70R_031593 [Stipagrostis hirtigluma subsp. patula]